MNFIVFHSITSIICKSMKSHQLPCYSISFHLIPFYKSYHNLKFLNTILRFNTMFSQQNKDNTIFIKKNKKGTLTGKENKGGMVAGFREGAIDIDVGEREVLGCCAVMLENCGSRRVVVRSWCFSQPKHRVGGLWWLFHSVMFVL